jgi:ABC-type sugar transport system ATPase subunit
MGRADLGRDYLVHARGLSKRFGAVTALDGVDFCVSRGAVHGVLGKNGAGKSTLMRLIAGQLAPSSGTIEFDGVDITAASVAERKTMGIHLMEQHTEVFAALSVAEMLALPDYPRRRGFVDWKAMRSRARERLDRYGMDVDVNAPAGSLSLADQKKVSLIRTLADNGKLAILDEPTTAMSLAERTELFEWIHELSAEGLTFIYITHFNHDIREACDEYTVLRDGRLASTGTSVAGLSGEQLSKLVTGADVVEFERQSREPPPVLLSVKRLEVHDCEPVSFVIGRGEIVGLAGLPGSGAQRVARALSGLEPVRGGDVHLDGRKLKLRHPSEAIGNGIAYLPNDRIGEGLVPELTVRENLHVGNWPRRLPGLVDRAAMERGFMDARASLGIKVSRAQQLISELSGGNQQKVLLGRLVATTPKILILDEPTAGVDVEAKEDVHRLIDRLTSEGIGVIVLAYDPAELVRLVDRALVFRDGALVDELAAGTLTGENVLTDLSHSRVGDGAA